LEKKSKKVKRAKKLNKNKNKTKMTIQTSTNKESITTETQSLSIILGHLHISVTAKGNSWTRPLPPCTVLIFSSKSSVFVAQHCLGGISTLFVVELS